MDQDRSVAQRVETQHHLLESSLQGARRAVKRRSQAEASERLRSLSRSLEAHLRLEEDFYFPQKRQADPSLEPELDSLVEEHAQLRSELEAVVHLLVDESMTGVEPAIARFESTFRRHEAREVKLLQR